jgi:hypothetical protein
LQRDADPSHFGPEASGEGDSAAPPAHRNRRIEIMVRGLGAAAGAAGRIEQSLVIDGPILPATHGRAGRFFDAAGF